MTAETETPVVDYATEAELRDLFSMEPDDEIPASPIQVCAGEWVKCEGDMWRFVRDPGALFDEE
jgi:hypothetical protein